MQNNVGAAEELLEKREKILGFILDYGGGKVSVWVGGGNITCNSLPPVLSPPTPQLSAKFLLSCSVLIDLYFGVGRCEDSV